MDEASGSGTRPRLKTYPGLNDQQAAQLEQLQNHQQLRSKSRSNFNNSTSTDHTR